MGEGVSDSCWNMSFAGQEETHASTYDTWGFGGDNSIIIGAEKKSKHRRLSLEYEAAGRATVALVNWNQGPGLDLLLLSFTLPCFTRDQTPTVAAAVPFA